jgi:hypothetical protein
MATWTLICPFLNQSSDFALGVEFGRLYARMRIGEDAEISDYFCIENQDQILLVASRLGWEVVEMSSWDADWFWCLLRKRE